ncbi:hypothetical protein LSH36_274g06043 [Paralvinella palmiformis]|uniref:Uncharacterized protein n=1 Tax=Paralvinella palmiformis TaxID=53620 RepID=A0AAD9N413_9ANNE|nr:hypothetical protein LSH36_274g06043 [Paralvinella palmiformis]
MEASSTADKTLFLFRVNGRLSIRNDKRTTSTAMRQLFVDVKQNWSSAKTETESVSREWETNWNGQLLELSDVLLQTKQSWPSWTYSMLVRRPTAAMFNVFIKQPALWTYSKLFNNDMNSGVSSRYTGVQDSSHGLSNKQFVVMDVVEVVVFAALNKRTCEPPLDSEITVYNLRTEARFYLQKGMKGSVIDTQEELDRSIATSILPGDLTTDDLERELTEILEGDYSLVNLPKAEPHQDLINALCQMKVVEDDLPTASGVTSVLPDDLPSVPDDLPAIPDDLPAVPLGLPTVAGQGRGDGAAKSRHLPEKVFTS